MTAVISVVATPWQDPWGLDRERGPGAMIDLIEREMSAAKVELEQQEIENIDPNSLADEGTQIQLQFWIDYTQTLIQKLEPLVG
jgi:hypothetical protein